MPSPQVESHADAKPDLGPSRVHFLFITQNIVLNALGEQEIETEIAEFGVICSHAKTYMPMKQKNEPKPLPLFGRPKQCFRRFGVFEGRKEREEDIL